MGFSIGRFLGSLASTVVGSIPIIGPLIGAVAGGFSTPPPGPYPGGSQVGPTVFTPAQAMSTVPALVRGAGTLLRSLLARASATLGKRITRSGVLSLVREVGIVAAATALGLTAVEVAQIIASKPTMRRIHSLTTAIAKVCPPAVRRRRPTPARHHHHA